jgi:hypothetical protein
MFGLGLGSWNVIWTTGEGSMSTAAPIRAERPAFDDYALAFLGSEFAGDTYLRWPIDRRLEVYLRHQGLSRIADTGELFDALLDCVMVNFAKARRDGLLSQSTVRERQRQYDHA